MTKLHKILFFFWKVLMRCSGFKKGTLIESYSTEKGKWIKGAITNLVGCSVTRSKYDFSFQVQYFEPLSGNDARFFSRGYYGKEDIGSKLRTI